MPPPNTAPIARQPTCARCTAPLTPTRTGKTRRGKHYCTAQCQRAAVVERRQWARAAITTLVGQLVGAEHPAGEQLHQALHTLGLLPSRKTPA